MTISERDWNNYVQRLSQLDRRAGEAMGQYIKRYGTEDTEGLIVYANALVTKYGEGSAELAAQMYDEMAAAAKVSVPAAEPAEVASPAEVAKAVYKTLSSPPSMKGAVSRMVKQAGADTTLKNALRDGAEFAWVPSGDSCAFCITLASRGWQRASKKAIKGGHAEHIHAHCDCNYAIRFHSNTNVAGYDPGEYLRMYENAEGKTPEEKINAMRRAQRDANRDAANAQQRAAYRARRELKAEGAKKITLEGSTGAGKRGKISMEKDYSHAEFTGSKPLSWHWDKHSSEFPGWTSEQYLARARELLSMQLVDGEVEQGTRSDGSISRYCYSANEFVATTNDGNLRTFFRPKQGREYWDDEHKRN